MLVPYYHVDAFTNKLFSGNPAAVCILENLLDDQVLFSIARENNLPVTTFLVRENNIFHIRWITPEYELKICGHGTVAAGFAIFNYIEPTWNKVIFSTPAEQFETLYDKQLVTLNFPARTIEKCKDIPFLIEGLGAMPSEVYQDGNDRCIAIYSSPDELLNIKPDVQILKKMAHKGITITAPGLDCDFVSRTFYPQKNHFEDAATGASHCLLAPYWAGRLNKHEFHARQLSTRGGEMFCRLNNGRVFIGANAVLFKQGNIVL